MLPESPIPVPTDLAARLEQAGRAAAETEGLQALTVFGSVARGTAHAWSDVDIGALFDATPTFERWATLLALFESAVGRPVDLVDLARAPLPLRGRAVLEGQPIVVLNEAIWCNFVTRTTLEWLDYRPLYERAVRESLRMLTEARP